MVETIQAQKINLLDLKLKFGLERTDNGDFFQEWQENLPELTDLEMAAMDEVKQEYLHLSQYPLLEPVVKLVVLSPLLKWAGFYRNPFFITGEKEVRISSEDEATIITGRLDRLVFTPEFWVLVIEAKKTAYSLEVGIPQALAYMLASPNLEKPNYGFVTNGTDFIFLKLIQQEKLVYSESDLFSIRRRHNDLWNVLQILKRLSQLVIQGNRE